MSLPIKYRKAVEADFDFIYSSWLKSYRNSEATKHLTNAVFFHHHKAIVKNILESKNTETLIICSDKDDDQLYGYIVVETIYSEIVLHYVYVKYNFRKLKLISDLCKSTNILDKVNFITHLPRKFDSSKSRFQYNPYLLSESKQ